MVGNGASITWDYNKLGRAVSAPGTHRKRKDGFCAAGGAFFTTRSRQEIVNAPFPFNSGFDRDRA